MTGVPPWRRDLVLVSQSDALWPHLSVFEHVAFGLRERRVALARTLVPRPRALLLDEPLSNLDAKLRAQMRIELRRLHREVGITTVFVTHDQAEAMALSTRLAVFDRGAVTQVGTPAEVYRRPRTRFVAEFVGAANVLPGRVERGPDGRRVRVSDRLALRSSFDEAHGSAGATPAPRAEASALCVVRPGAIQRVEDDAPVANRFGATVTSAVYLGGRLECELALAGGLTLRAELAAHGGAGAPAPGPPLTAAIAPEDVVVLLE